MDEELAARRVASRYSAARQRAMKARGRCRAPAGVVRTRGAASRAEARQR